MSNSVRRVSVSILMDDGEEHLLICNQPRPTGGNPRFISQQIDYAMRDLAIRADGLANLHGTQIRPTNKEAA